MRSRSLAVVALAVAVAGATGACFDGRDGDALRITDLEVTNELDFGALDVEIHLFDAFDHTHLGCSGEDEGLEIVDESDLAYALSAYFRTPNGDFQVTPLDLAGLDVEVQVIEDDLDPCPVQPGPDDDVIGIAAGLDFTSGRPVAFDSVTYLRIAIE